MNPSASRLLFMGRIFEQPWGGVREMAEGLLGALAELCESQGRRIEVLSPRAGLCPVDSPAVREVALEKFGDSRILWDHVTVPRYANAQRDAVLYNVKLILPEGLRIAGFTTFHDLMYFRLPGLRGAREYLRSEAAYIRFMAQRTVRRSALIHTVSECTAADARRIFPDADPATFRPIHIGVDQRRWAAARAGNMPPDALAALDLPARYIFYAGGLSHRKNVGALVEAFAELRDEHPDVSLVLTGGKTATRPDDSLEAAAARLPPGALRRLGAVDRDLMPWLYAKALFFVYPSRYEGFGLPPLEAQAAGCPVICSAVASLPEVMGKSASLFDPGSPVELAARMKEMVEPATRRNFRTLGDENVARFAWSRTAERFLELMDDVYASHSISARAPARR